MTLLLASSASAQSASSIHLGNLDVFASQAFERGAGSSARTEVRAISEARGDVPGRLTEFESMLMPSFNITEEAGAESVGVATLWFEAGPRRARERSAADAQADAADARLQSQRWAYIVGAQQRYLVWWQAAAVAAHLREDISELDEEVSRLRDAAAAGHLARLDVLDLEGELARLQGELLEAERSAANAEIEVQRYLATELPVAAPSGGLDGFVTAHGDDVAHVGSEPTESAWTRLLQETEAFPAVIEEEARAEALRHEAATARSIPVELGAGVEIHHIAQSSSTWGAVQIGARVPLQRSERRDAAYQRGAAAAADQEALWQAQRITAWLRGQLRQINVLEEMIEELDATWVSAQQERVEALVNAFEGRHVDAQRLIYARRDLHEALHRRIELEAELMVLREAGLQLEHLLHELGAL